jgi:hypothetical protein
VLAATTITTARSSSHGQQLEVTANIVFVACLEAKIQQSKMLVTCQRFGNLFLFGLAVFFSSDKVQSHGYLLAAVI